MLIASCGQPNRVLGVVVLKARYAVRGTMRVWSAHAAGSPSEGDRSAEQAVAADRFAREIVAFLNSPDAARSRRLNGKRWAASRTTTLLLCL